MVTMSSVQSLQRDRKETHLRESSLQLELKESFWNTCPSCGWERRREMKAGVGQRVICDQSLSGCWDKGLTRYWSTLSVELNRAEALLIFDEYGRLVMVKLIVRVFRWCPIAAGRGEIQLRTCLMPD